MINLTAFICIGTCANQHHLHHHHSHHHQLHRRHHSRHPHRRHRRHGAVTLWSPRWLETSPLMSQGTKLTRRWHRANQRWNNSLEYKILSSENSIFVCFARLVSLLMILKLHLSFGWDNKGWVRVFWAPIYLRNFWSCLILGHWHRCRWPTIYLFSRNIFLNPVTPHTCHFHVK